MCNDVKYRQMVDTRGRCGPGVVNNDSIDRLPCEHSDIQPLDGQYKTGHRDSSLGQNVLHAFSTSKSIHFNGRGSPPFIMHSWHILNPPSVH